MARVVAGADDWSERFAADIKSGSQMTLGDVIDRLGPDVVSTGTGTGAELLDRAVTGVELLGSTDSMAVSPGSVVLGVGLTDGSQVAACVPDLADAGAVALLVRESVVHSSGPREGLAGAPMSVWGVAAGISWMRVLELIQAARQSAPLGNALSSDTPPIPDLFGVANSLADLLVAPTTIEETSGRVLAFSYQQSATDEGRRNTILAMQVPRDVERLQHREGIYQHIYRSATPVRVPDVVGGNRPRIAMRIMAGSEPLGAVWAVRDTPLTPQQERGLIEASEVAAMVILRARMDADMVSRLRLEQVTQLLAGGVESQRVADKLSLAENPLCVAAIAFAPADDDDPAMVRAHQQRVARDLAQFLAARSRHAVSGLVGSCLYAVVPLRTAMRGDQQLEHLIADFISHHRSRTDLYAGVGRVVTDPADIDTSRDAADAALRVLRHTADPSRQVASLADVETNYILLRLSDVLKADRIGPSPSLRAIREYDDIHQTSLLLSLRCWLEAFGDVSAAARGAAVHKNTLRYRLRRAQEIGCIDLTDPDTRFALSIRLRIPD